MQAINTALGGEDVSYLHTGQHKYPLPIRLELPEGDKTSLANLLTIRVHANNGRDIAIADLVSLEETITERTIYHKNLKPVVFVTADMSGDL